MVSEFYKAPYDEDLYIHKYDDGTFDVSVNFASFLHDYTEEELIDYFEECIRITRQLSSNKDGSESV